MRRAGTTIVTVVAMGGLLTACVTGGDQKVSSGAPAATSSSPDEAVSTTPNQAPSSTTTTTETATTGTVAPTDSDDIERGKRLLGLLPTPTEVGAGYEETSDDGLPGGGNEDSGEYDPFIEQCPGLASAELLEPYDYGGKVRAHSYGPEGESTIGVELADGVPPGTESAFEQVVADLADCHEITIPDGDVENGAMTIDVESSDAHGDYGVVSRLTLHYELYGSPFDFASETRTFVIDDVQVTIVGRTSINDDGTVDPIDTDAVERMADLMEQRAATL